MPPTPLILGLSGAALTAAEERLLAARPPFGACLFRRNIEAPAQLAALVASLRAACPGIRLMVDQEGGRVARLRPPHWRAHPPAAAFGALALRRPADAARAAGLTGWLIGAEARLAGFDLVAAPVLDLACEGADPVIGDRAFSSDPVLVATLAGAFARGLFAAGVQPIGKHAPGHGAATADSHVALPELDGTDPAALAPFRALAPEIGWMMTAHVRFRREDPARPATLSPAVIGAVVRGAIGFEGVLVSDDLAMGALDGPPLARARACLAAGCDIALECGGGEAVAASLLEGLDAMPPATAARIARADAMRAARDRGPADAASIEAGARERDRLLGGPEGS